jgi:MFS family permease
VLLPAFFVISLGYGMIEISLGVVAATIFKKRLGTMLNLSHFFYGMGAMFAPLATVGIMSMRFGSQTLSWRYAYLIILSTAIVPLIPALIGRIKKQEYDKKKTGYAAMLKRPMVWLVVAVLALGVLTELGTAAWLVMYLERSQSLSGENAALGLTLFFAGFTLTRLFIGPLTDKIGFVNTLIIVAAFAGSMLIFGTLLGSSGIALVVATGIGVAPIYPTVMALVAKLFQDEIDKAITVVATATGLFMVIANLSLGGLINQMRLIFTEMYGEAGVSLAHSGGMIFLGICGFGSCLAAVLLRRKLKKTGELV